MKVFNRAIDKNLTQTELDHLLNSLVVTPQVFADLSGLGGRMWGVTSGCEPSGFTLNECARHMLIQQLIKAHNVAEKELGYPVTPQYHTETLPLTQNRYFALQRLGVEALVSLSVTDPQEFTSVAVDPVWISDVTLVDSGNGYTIAQMDASLVLNPNEMVLFDATTFHRYHPQDKRGFPRLNAGNWEVALSNDFLPAKIGVEQINAFHCKLVFVDTPSVATVGAGETLTPVYPGSEQIIPEALDSEPILSGQTQIGTRFWFYSYNLVNEAFSYEGVDLALGEFYKLLPTISFKLFGEVAATPVVIYRKAVACVAGTTESTNETDIFTELVAESHNLIDQKNGIIEVFYDNSQALIDDIGIPVKVRFQYKTNPKILNAEKSTSSVQDGVAHLAASTLPFKSCGCVVDKDGFIQTAQESYDEVRFSLTGELVQTPVHGQLYGRLVFIEKMEESVHVHKVVFL